MQPGSFRPSGRQTRRCHWNRSKSLQQRFGSWPWESHNPRVVPARPWANKTPIKTTTDFSSVAQPSIESPSHGQTKRAKNKAPNRLCQWRPYPNWKKVPTCSCAVVQGSPNSRCSMSAWQSVLDCIGCKVFRPQICHQSSGTIPQPSHPAKPCFPSGSRWSFANHPTHNRNNSKPRISHDPRHHSPIGIPFEGIPLALDLTFKLSRPPFEIGLLERQTSVWLGERCSVFERNMASTT